MVLARHQCVAFSAGKKHDIPGGQKVLAAIRASKDRTAHCQVMEVGMAWLRGKSKSKGRPGLDASVLDAMQSHAGQQLADQVGGLGLVWSVDH